MFCPRCSQQQLPGEVRFCSRCGLQLVAISQILNTNGMIYPNSDVSRERLPLIKRKELRSGAKLIFASFFLIIPCLIMTGIFDNPFPLLLIPITFTLGLAQILYYFFFGESILPLKNQKQSFEFSENTQPLNFQSTNDLPFSYMDSNSINTVEFMRQGNSTKRTSNLFDGR
jgi:hypothetical protein